MYNIMLAKTLKNVVKLIEKQPAILKFVIYVAIIYGLYHLFLLVQWKLAEQGLFVQEGFTGKGKEFTLFYWKDCGHCKKMMPEWDKFQSTFKKPGITVNKVEKDQNPKAMQALDIQGFPSIMLLNNGKKVKDYEGERTASAFAAFANAA